MEEEKEKAEEEEEEELHHHVEAAAASSVDCQGFPMMHWEELGLRIAELEKQEQERRERSKDPPWRDVWEEEEEEDCSRCRVAVVTSRFHNHRNLQLCFINNSDSEDEEEEEGSNKKEVGRTGRRGAGLKQEVVIALRTLRDELLATQRLVGSICVAERKHLERWELQERSAQQLSSLGASLQQEVHALSSQLVAQLLVRDQLRTKQDAMLLDLQDLT
ncbi:schwannomin-interacting protein 1-like [Clinocottus analis]|uniref:schwannomin-interacting protein 1-like n=1 Tax=Clinocottus analis TaxID=304258 RepID=UPI0035C15816